MLIWIDERRTDLVVCYKTFIQYLQRIATSKQNKTESLSSAFAIDDPIPPNSKGPVCKHDCYCLTFYQNLYAEF